MTENTPLSWPLPIEKAAAILGVSKTIIRFWAEEFGIESTDRQYVSASQMLYFRVCHRLIQVEEMTLQDAKTAFDKEKIQLAERVAAMDVLENVRQHLVKWV